MYRKFLLWLFLSNVVVSQGVAQSDTSLTVLVDQVFIIGNKKTKPRIIRREMAIQPGHYYSWDSLEILLLNDRKRIMNTQLFLRTDIRKVMLDSSKIDLIVNVAERWYTVPSPYLRLSDRNLNDWITNYGLDFSRVEIGLKISRANFRGLNERLSLTAQLGFTKQFALSYSKPYIDRAQKNGVQVGFSYVEANNIAYQTIGHVPIFTDSLRQSLSTLLVRGGWTHRGSYYSTHAVNLDYIRRRLTDTIPELNPQYFLNQGQEQQYLSLSYRFVHDKRDVVGYPLRGYYASATVQKLGLGIFNDLNMGRVLTQYVHFVPWKKNYFFATSLNTLVSVPRKQPYANLIGLGYQGRWLRGYEVYVVEGQHFLLQQNSFSRRLINTVFYLNDIIPLDQFNEVPFAVYLKVFFDQGMVQNELDYPLRQRLNNRYLYSAGVGLDVVSFYDFVLRVGYPLAISANLKQRLFLSFRASF